MVGSEVKIIVDTPQFQRMRHIKQLGVCSLVFPGAKHDRFFHSIGTAHLAYNLMKDLKSNQPELCIIDRDVVCVVLAALMHDLGHPAFSHMFETFMASIGHTKWTHEQASTVLVKEILKSINLSLIAADKEGDDLEFICELIDPPKAELNKRLFEISVYSATVRRFEMFAKLFTVCSFFSLELHVKVPEQWNAEARMVNTDERKTCPQGIHV